MFEMIWQWFQRPVVINLDYEAISSDTKLGVLTSEAKLNADQVDQIKKSLSNFHGDFKFVVLVSGNSLQTLSDEELKEIGLVRIIVSDSDRYQYEV